MNRLNRPYAIRGARKSSEEPSVTTILGQHLHKPALAYAAAKEAAIFAVLHRDRWEHLATDHAVDVIRRHPFGVWDGRAAMGTVVHGVNEAYCAALDVDVERLIDQAVASDSKARLWRDADRDELVEQVLGYVLGLEAWWRDFRPTQVRSEMVVRWPRAFIGQVDLRCVIDAVWSDGEMGPRDVICDIKSSSQQDEEKGLYPREWALQVAGYGMARETVFYELEEDPKLKSGSRVVEAGTGPWSRPERYAIIHLRGDERYGFYEVPVTRATERAFFRLARAYPHVSQLEKVVLPRLTPREETAA